MNEHKKFFQNMDYAQKILFCCENGNASSFAYNQLIEKLAAASIQMDRIWSYANTSKKTPEPDPNDPDFQIKANEYLKKESAKAQRLFIDIHFYFVSWGNVKLMMAVLAKQPEFKSANILFNSYRKIIEHYVHGRNTFEHFDQRLPGGKNHSRIKEVQSPGGAPRKIFRGFSKEGFYLHSDKQWDIKPTSLDILRNIVNEFIEKIHESIDLIISQKFK